MTLRRSTLTFAAVALFGLGAATNAHAADPPTYTIAPGITDAAIVDTVPSRGNHLVWLAPASKRVGKLLVFLPTGGQTNLPTEFTELGTVAGRLGYHTLILAYRNEAPIAAAPTANPPGCGDFVDPTPAGSTCARDARLEILDGKDESTLVDVNLANSIENRLDKALAYLALTYPADGWSKFIDGNGKPNWPETVIAGSSLGAGEAVMIAEKHLVFRAVLLHGWSDASHPWVKRDATPSNRYSTLIHMRDRFFARTCNAYATLGLATTCPLPGFPPATLDESLLIENRRPPFGTSQLVFNLEPFKLTGVTDPYHTSTSRNDWIPREADLTPSRKLLDAWRSVFGDSDADTYLDFVDNCPAIANTDQTDSDRNLIGDACGPTFATGTVGGSVPATLALTLGTPAAFAPFVPGADRNYDAGTTATVISSAGDALLSVSDPSANATGRLVNGTFSLTEPLQARALSAGGVGGPLAPLAAAPLSLLTYAGPSSNDAVAIAFRQHIAPTQALRTGAYSKTLTFTLSTTTP
jgi:hypothetical protein